MSNYRETSFISIQEYHALCEKNYMNLLTENQYDYEQWRIEIGDQTINAVAVTVLLGKIGARPESYIRFLSPPMISFAIPVDEGTVSFAHNLHNNAQEVELAICSYMLTTPVKGTGSSDNTLSEMTRFECKNIHKCQTSLLSLGAIFFHVISFHCLSLIMESKPDGKKMCLSLCVTAPEV